MPSFTILCQLHLGCMGCCGRDFISKEKIEEAIHKNTLEFSQLSPQAEEQLIKFRDRTYPSDLRYGVCRNLIKENSRLLCPLHPKLNQGKDLRKRHCDINYFCKTAQEFIDWDKEKQDLFLDFLKNKNFDNLTYSMKMDDNSLLEEFSERFK